MGAEGTVRSEISNGIATIVFSHERGNSLPGSLLRKLAASIRECGQHRESRVISICSEGEKAFCAGASFDELVALRNSHEAQEFFMGFAQVILAIRDCPLFVVARVQGKTVGGGVGLVAACDYALACQSASIRLSEFALGFGPFVISAAVQRKIGLAAFSAATIDTQWRDAAWCEKHGLFAHVYPSIAELDAALADCLLRLAASNPAASAHIKRILWAGTEGWEEILKTRAAISAELSLSPFVQKCIEDARQKA